MNYQEQSTINKYGLTIPLQHKFLSYVSKPLDLMLFSDNLEAFKAYQEKHPDIISETTLRACVEYGASACFMHFFEKTRSKNYYFEKLFQKPESPILGVQCPYYYVKNNNIIKTIDELYKNLFPGQEALELLTDTEQIEYCAARFGVQGRIKLAEKLLNKLKSPIFMVNNMHVFEYAYTNKAENFCKIYLEKIEEKKLIESFLLCMFSTSEVGNKKKHINFFDKFTKEQYDQDNRTHHLVNDFIVRNIKNNSIAPEFQELIMAYCLHNNNDKNFQLYNDARMLEKQNLISTIKDPWKYMNIQHEPYRYIEDRHTFGLNMKNNALKLFKHDEDYINKWISTLKVLNVEDVKSSFSSLFCLGGKSNVKSSLETLFNHIDWQAKDEKGNSFAHYLVYFYENSDKHFMNRQFSKEFISLFNSLARNYPNSLINKNNEGVMPVELFLNVVKNSKTLNALPEDEINEIEALMKYATLHNELSTKEISVKRMKI